MAGTRRPDRATAALSGDTPTLVEGDEHRLGESLHALLQRAHAIGKNFGEHGNDPPGQIDAGAAILGLDIERTTRRNEMCHVGDVHA